MTEKQPSNMNNGNATTPLPAKKDPPDKSNTRNPPIHKVNPHAGIMEFFFNAKRDETKKPLS